MRWTIVQQPGTKSSCQPADKPLVHCLSRNHFPGHALHESGLRRQIGVGPLVSSQERRAAVVPRINRLSTADKPQVNRWFCSSINLHGLSCVCASGESFRTVVFDALGGGQEGRLFPGRTDLPIGVPSYPAPPRPAAPPCAVPPRPARGMFQDWTRQILFIHGFAREFLLAYMHPRLLLSLPMESEGTFVSDAPSRGRPCPTHAAPPSNPAMRGPASIRPWYVTVSN